LNSKEGVNERGVEYQTRTAGQADTRLVGRRPRRISKRGLERRGGRRPIPIVQEGQKNEEINREWEEATKSKRSWNI
jgi:hypothetical protein